jgi:diketogulonate reductase-like aldo/keto reductase
VTGCSGPVLTPSTAETWAALEACVEAGLARSIGLSNFSRPKLQQLLDSPRLKIRPAVLQVRTPEQAYRPRYGRLPMRPMQQCVACTRILIDNPA